MHLKYCQQVPNFSDFYIKSLFASVLENEDYPGSKVTVEGYPMGCTGNQWFKRVAR